MPLKMDRKEMEVVNFIEQTNKLVLFVIHSLVLFVIHSCDPLISPDNIVFGFCFDVFTGCLNCCYVVSLVMESGPHGRA
jgi:hypothetical protein